MDRLTGDFKGVSMFATVEQALQYNRLAQYENTGLTPDEIAALRDQLDHAGLVVDAFRTDLAAMTAERDAWQRRAVAAEKDIHDMLYDATLLVDNGLCDWCERWDNELCWSNDCKAECKWRGPEEDKHE